jgi:hypothetical protein
MPFKKNQFKNAPQKRLRFEEKKKKKPNVAAGS